jgi:hypothetical protein
MSAFLFHLSDFSKTLLFLELDFNLCGLILLFIGVVDELLGVELAFLEGLRLQFEFIFEVLCLNPELVYVPDRQLESFLVVGGLNFLY